MVDHDLDPGRLQHLQRRRGQPPLQRDVDMPVEVGDPPQQELVVLPGEVGQLVPPGELQADADDAVVPHPVEDIALGGGRDDHGAAQPPMLAQLLDHIVVVVARDADARDDAEVDAVGVEHRQIVLGAEAVAGPGPGRGAERHVVAEDVGVRVHDRRI